MPELPEVENVRRSLESQGATGQTFQRVELRRANLRTPLSKKLSLRLPGQTILGLRRRAKFLLFETENYLVLSHLGMTGSWRPGPISLKKHDHIVFHFKSGWQLIFNDPRRFGLLELVEKEKPSAWLTHLGLEPLESEFNAEALFEATRGLKVPIKNFLMDQKRVVGVGNIYASEALFESRVRPTRPAGRITRAEAQVIVSNVQAVLQRAIEAGGSTIRDYRNSQGEEGRFQRQLKVYGRADESCVQCNGKIRAKILSGRNTFWCPQCQH